MVACIAAGRPYVPWLAAALAEHTPYTVTADWGAFERQAAGADCAVVWLERLDAAVEFTRLLSFRARLPLQPVVLVTHRDADSVRHLKDVFVNEVVWTHEAQRELWTAVTRARARGALARLEAGLRDVVGLPPALQRGLEFACAGPRPIHSVSALAALVGCDRRTLWRHWHGAVAARTAVTLQDVLDWLLLVRARARKSPDASWRAVADELDVHEHTLARIAQRLTGWTLREMAGQRLDVPFATFEARVLTPLRSGARGDPHEARRLA